MAVVNKWLAAYNVYERGEVICQREVIYPDTADGKDIHFDTESEAEAYLNKHINGEFAMGYAIEMPVEEGSGIPYSEVLRLEAEAAEKRRLTLWTCPFCGKEPRREGAMAHCPTCDIRMPDHKWNRRNRRGD